MPDPIDTSPRISRRTLLTAGIAGGALLLVARWLYVSTSAPQPAEPRPIDNTALDTKARAIVAAIVPALLEGALPAGEEAGPARAQVLANVDHTIAGLPPSVRNELDQLFSLLGFAPTRCLVAGVWSPWPEASREDVAAFLDRWQSSRFALLRSAYNALHQIVLAAWYGNARAWPAIGYSGPPSLEIG